jgi:hypothetical protein
MLCPTVRQHLQLLALLSSALHDPGFAAVIQRKGRADEVVAAAARFEDGSPLAARTDGRRRA